MIYNAIRRIIFDLRYISPIPTLLLMPPPASNPGYTGDTRRLGFFDTTRVGFVYGQGDGERIVRQLARTCHINFSSLKMGAGTTAKAALDYAFREGEEHGPPADPDASKAAREQADKAAELECTAGDRQDVEDACARIEESAVVRKGRTAERFLIQQVIELPGDSTPEQRKACAEALVQHWEDRGHPASAAVHGNGKVQPHVHAQATARPVDADGNVDRSALLWNSKQAVRDEREAVAGIVNEHCPGTVLFHGGRHEDVNIDRAARKEAGLMQTRLPRRAQHRPEQYERDETMPGRLAVAHERGRSWATAEAGRRKAEAARKAADREARRQARAAAIEAARQDREARKKARNRRAQAQAELRDLSAKQTAMLAELHKKAGRELPDLEDEKGRAAAWQFVREAEERRDSAAAAKKAEQERQDRAAAEKAVQDRLALDERQRLAAEAAERRQRHAEAKAEEKDRAAAPEPQRPGRDMGQDGVVEAWQLTRAQFFERARDARDASVPGGPADIRFRDVEPPVRIYHDPGHRLTSWRDGEPKDWVYERGGEVMLGWNMPPEVNQATAIASSVGYVHQLEVHYGVQEGKPVPAAVLADYPQPAPGGQKGGGRAGGDDGGGMEGGGRVRDDERDFSRPSRIAQVLLEIEQERQITR